MSHSFQEISELETVIREFEKVEAHGMSRFTSFLSKREGLCFKEECALVRKWLKK